jgi:hypothetical protein
MDWGYARPYAIGWYAVAPGDRKLYHIREYYGSTGTPNQGVKQEPVEVAKAIKRIEKDDPNLRGRHIIRVGDPAIWGSQTGESIGDMMEREGVFFEKGQHARMDGKMQIHHRLAFDEEGFPMLYVFSTCRNFIRTVPNLVYDEIDVEDVDTDGEDHIYDSLRYVCMENPIAPRRNMIEVKDTRDDPLNLYEDQKKAEYDRYNFMRM